MLRSCFHQTSPADLSGRVAGTACDAELAAAVRSMPSSRETRCRHASAPPLGTFCADSGQTQRAFLAQCTMARRVQHVLQLARTLPQAAGAGALSGSRLVSSSSSGQPVRTRGPAPCKGLAPAGPEVSAALSLAQHMGELDFLMTVRAGRNWVLAELPACASRYQVAVGGS